MIRLQYRRATRVPFLLQHILCFEYPQSYLSSLRGHIHTPFLTVFTVCSIVSTQLNLVLYNSSKENKTKLKRKLQPILKYKTYSFIDIYSLLSRLQFPLDSFSVVHFLQFFSKFVQFIINIEWFN